MPGRTPDAIARRASVLGIASAKNPYWTGEEDEILRKNYGWMSIKELQEKYLSNKSENAIKHRASRLGITSKKRQEWTKEELEIIKSYGEIPNEELQKDLPGRTLEAIAGKARSLGLGSTRSPAWTKEEDEIIKKTIITCQKKSYMKNICLTDQKNLLDGEQVSWALHRKGVRPGQMKKESQSRYC